MASRNQSHRSGCSFFWEGITSPVSRSMPAPIIRAAAGTCTPARSVCVNPRVVSLIDTVSSSIRTPPIVDLPAVAITARADPHGEAQPLSSTRPGGIAAPQDCRAVFAKLPGLGRLCSQGKLARPAPALRHCGRTFLCHERQRTLWTPPRSTGAGRRALRC